MRARVIALLAAAALGVGACGDDEGGSADLVPAIPANVPTETATSPSTTGKPFTLSSIKVSVTKGKKPTITKPSGDPPTKLVTKDIFVGKGPAAKSGDQLSMHYLGTLFDAKQFEASWDSGKPYDFQLGQGNVIAGWDQGIVGMKAGGRRLLVIPPDLAYGAQGQGASIPPDATLMFVVDLVKRTAG